VRFYRSLFPLALLFILCCFKAADACSCVMPGPPCNDYGEATAVFLGRVVDSAQRKSYTDKAGTKTVYDVGTIRFLVQESFKGVAGYEVEIHSGTGGGDCGYAFLRNESYLVYAYESREDKKLYTSVCTRTRHLSNASEDLLFLRGLSRTKPGGTIYGRLLWLTNRSEAERADEDRKMAGVKMNIKGETQTFQAVTNEEGEYRITGLPAGNYRALPQLPANVGAYAYRDEAASLSEHTCAEINFTVQFDGMVSGKVTDASGEPVKDVQLMLALEADLSKHLSTKTDAAGGYEFRPVLPGNYLLGVNLSWVPGKDNAYPKTFYPGVKDKSGAALIAVGEGEKLKGYDLTLPPRLTERELKITVVWPDGRPAVGADVGYFIWTGEGAPFGDRATADEKGMVTIQIFDDYTYIIYAEAEPSPNKDVHSEPSEVLITKKTKPLKFVLSQPGPAYPDVDKLRDKPREQ